MSGRSTLTHTSQSQVRHYYRPLAGEHILQKLRSSQGHLTTKRVYMKRFSFVAIGLIALAATSTIAVPNPSTEKVPAFPGTLANARYVYVASYDGDQFNPNLLPEDQAAISAVQNAIQEWGKLIVVYRPSAADILVESSTSRFHDQLATHFWREVLLRSTAGSRIQAGSRFKFEALSYLHYTRCGSWNSRFEQ